MDHERDLTPGFQSRWVVMVGKLYVAGLGRTYEGYHDGNHVPSFPGYVVTALVSHALQYSSRRDATALARSIGGQVFRTN